MGDAAMVRAVSDTTLGREDTLYSMDYSGKRVLITGGLGFIGSNLAIRLVQLGALVTIVDSCEPGCGGNPHNIAPIADRCKVVDLDIADADQVSDLVGKAEVIFNLAGEISHIHSMLFPERDLRINSLAQLRFLQVCAKEAPGVRIVYAGTRQVYGVPQYLPVDEDHPVRPVDFNGVHKLAGTMYHLMFGRMGVLDAVVLRLSNVYGPRMALGIPCQGFLSTFVRKLMLGETLEVFGDGSQLRDPLYVDDAVSAFLTAGAATKVSFTTYNVGGPKALSLRLIGETAAGLGSRSPVVVRPFPQERKQIDIGSYCTNNRRIEESLGWTPAIDFAEGLQRTVEFYRTEMDHYLGGGLGECVCDLIEHKGIKGRLVYVASFAGRRAKVNG